MDIYVIRMEDQFGLPTFWHYSEGAVALSQATIYTEGDSKTLLLPLGGRWVKFTEVPF